MLKEWTDNVLTCSVSPAIASPLGQSERGTAYGLAEGILIKQQKVQLCLKLNVLVKSMPAPVFCLSFTMRHKSLGTRADILAVL